MRIEDRFKIFQLYNNSTKLNKIEKGKNAQHIDKLEISEQARDFQAVLNAIKNIPDVRQDKIDELKDKIMSGNYNISAKDIIEKLVKEYKSSKQNG